jgi:hypothetical protein
MYLSFAQRWTVVIYFVLDGNDHEIYQIIRYLDRLYTSNHRAHTMLKQYIRAMFDLGIDSKMATDTSDRTYYT